MLASRSVTVVVARGHVGRKRKKARVQDVKPTAQRRRGTGLWHKNEAKPSGGKMEFERFSENDFASFTNFEKLLVERSVGSILKRDGNFSAECHIT